MSKYSEKKERQLAEAIAAEAAEAKAAKRDADVARKAEEMRQKAKAENERRKREEEAARMAEEARQKREAEEARRIADADAARTLREVLERVTPLVATLQKEYAETGNETKSNYYAAVGALISACDRIAKAVTRIEINVKFYSPTSGRGVSPETDEARAANLRPEATR